MKLFIFALLAVAACAEEEKKALELPYAITGLPLGYNAINTLPYYNNIYAAGYASPYYYNNYAPAISSVKIEAPKVELKKIELPKVEVKTIELPKIELPEVELKAAAPIAYSAPIAATTYAAAYAPATYAAATYAVPAAAASSQFQAQDELKNVNYGYANINSIKQEVGNALTGVSGSYSYIDANGLPQQVNYIANALGFQTQDSRLPVAPVFDGKAPEPVVYTGVAPEPVEDTAEVKAAKAEFMAAFDAEKSREKRESDPAYIYGYNALPFAYSAGYYNTLPVSTYNYPYTYGYAPRAYLNYW